VSDYGGGYTNPKSVGISPQFDISVILGFISWALVGECVFESSNSSLIKEFHVAVRCHCGEQWLETWWSTQGDSKPSLDSTWVHGSLPPSSLLEFVFQVDLLLFAEQEFKEEISRNPNVFRDPRLLYCTVVGNACTEYEKYPFWYHSSQRWRSFAAILLANGVNPNMAVEIAIGPDRGRLMSSVDDDSGSISERPQPITIMHLALAVACTTSWRRFYDQLDMLRVLVEGGGDANISNYQNLWGSKENTHTERSAIHYLLSSKYSEAMPFQSEEGEDNRALTECITAFLNYGADPNTVDSNKISILECALPVCPPELVELMLEKGGKVTPKLLLESGEPVDYAGAILYKPRWRRPECYTAEARIIARRHNPDWPNLEDERDGEKERDAKEGPSNLLYTFGGFLGNLVKPIKHIVAK